MPSHTTVTVTRPRTPHARAIVREHGDVFTYVRHMEQPHLAVLISCTCPSGHGPAHNPWTGWIDPTLATLDLGQGTQAPASPYALPEVEAEEIDLDLAPMAAAA